MLFYFDVSVIIDTKIILILQNCANYTRNKTMNNYLYKITNILKSLIKFDISFIDSHHEFFGDPNVYNDIQKLMQQTSLI